MTAPISLGGRKKKTKRNAKFNVWKNGRYTGKSNQKIEDSLDDLFGIPRTKRIRMMYRPI